ncbi:hypothetical protein [Kitasatospora sp. NPDC047058]|uniref:hypothetical protein n=1 Tax=Kitasatospora sp. NPDC047058 TaxID=3155620 RepID=UPI0034075469
MAGVAAAGVGALLPTSAQAADGRGGRSARSAFPFPLPATGVEIPSSLYAANVPLQINAGVLNLDFKGGIRGWVERSDADGLKLSVIGFRATAESPVLGTVTMEHSDTPLSVLRMGIN